MTSKPRGTVSPDTLEAFKRARTAVERDDLANAERDLIVAESGGMSKAAYNLGILYERRGETERAVAAYQRAIAAGYGQAGYGLGRLFHNAGEYERAVEAFREGVKLGSGLAAIGLGGALAALSDYAGADQAYAEAERLGEPSAAERRARLLERRRVHGGASAADSAGAVSRETREALARSRAAVERGDLVSAECDLIIAEAGGASTAAYNLGIVHALRGETEEAIAAYRRAIVAGHSEAAYNLGHLYFHQAHDYMRAAEAFREGVKLGSGRAAVGLGAALTALRDYAGAGQAFAEAERLGEPSAWEQHARSLEERGLIDAAADVLRRGAREPSAATALGALLVRHKRWDEALIALRQADELGDADGTWAYSSLLARQGNASESLSALQRSCERGSPDGAYWYAKALESAGRQLEAEIAYRRADDLGQPDAAAALRRLRRRQKS